MDGSVLPPKLLSRLSAAASAVRGGDFIQIYSHHDADGLSAAAIAAKALSRAGKQFAVTIFPTLDGDRMEAVRGSRAGCILMTDMGASYLEELGGLGRDVVVLDHHGPGGDSEDVIYANPHLFGVDGMTSACGATMAFLFAVQLDPANWDLVQLAFAGIVGDRQNIDGLSGYNRLLLEGAVERGLVSVSRGSMVPPGPLSGSLFLGTDPYIRGVSGSQAGVARILADAGVGADAMSSDLAEDEARRLSSLIAAKLAAQGVPLRTMREVSRDRYRLRDWNMDAEALAELFNACGRLGEGGLGVAMGMGDAASMARASDMDMEYRNSVVSSAAALDRDGLRQMDRIQWFDSSLSGLTGVLCGVAMQFFGRPEKPTIGVNSSDGTAKASARGTWDQLDRGVDLSAVMRGAAAAVGGTGGGHRIASGASFPAGRRDEFLKEADRIVAEQLGSSRRRRPRPS